MHCGIESGSPERLKTLDKVGSVEEMAAGVRRILSHGMEVLCFFILGFPGESEREIEQTVRVALDLNPSYASFHTFTPYPGTEYAVDPGDGPLFVPATHPDALPFRPSATDCASARTCASTCGRATSLSRLARREYRSLLRQARIFASQVGA